MDISALKKSDILMAMLLSESLKLFDVYTAFEIDLIHFTNGEINIKVPQIAEKARKLCGKYL